MIRAINRDRNLKMYMTLKSLLSTAISVPWIKLSTARVLSIRSHLRARRAIHHQILEASISRVLVVTRRLLLLTLRTAIKIWMMLYHLIELGVVIRHMYIHLAERVRTLPREVTLMILTRVRATRVKIAGRLSACRIVRLALWRLNTLPRTTRQQRMLVDLIDGDFRKTALINSNILWRMSTTCTLITRILAGSDSRMIMILLVTWQQRHDARLPRNVCGVVRFRVVRFHLSGLCLVVLSVLSQRTLPCCVVCHLLNRNRHLILLPLRLVSGLLESVASSGKVKRQLLTVRTAWMLLGLSLPLRLRRAVRCYL